MVEVAVELDYVVVPSVEVHQDFLVYELAVFAWRFLFEFFVFQVYLNLIKTINQINKINQLSSFKTIR